jgi:hypothetical protein
VSLPNLSDPPSALRRSFQFSLRTIFIFTTIVALFSAGIFSHFFYARVLMFILWAIAYPSVLVSVSIYGHSYLRSFCIGALTSFIPILLLGYILISNGLNFLSDFNPLSAPAVYQTVMLQNSLPSNGASTSNSNTSSSATSSPNQTNLLSSSSATPNSNFGVVVNFDTNTASNGGYFEVVDGPDYTASVYVGIIMFINFIGGLTVVLTRWMIDLDNGRRRLALNPPSPGDSYL